jgi:hypothetical protein
MQIAQIAASRSAELSDLEQLLEGVVGKQGVGFARRPPPLPEQSVLLDRIGQLVADEFSRCHQLTQRSGRSRAAKVTRDHVHSRQCGASAGDSHSRILNVPHRNDAYRPARKTRLHQRYFTRKVGSEQRPETPLIVTE